MRIDQYQNLNNIMNRLKLSRQEGIVSVIFSILPNLFFGGLTLLLGLGCMLQAPPLSENGVMLLPGCVLTLASFIFLKRVYESVQYYSWSKVSVENLPDGVLSIIDKQCQNAVQLGSGAVTQDAVLSYTPYGPLILLNRDIVWIYILNTTYRYGGINTGNTNRIICCTSDGKRHTITTVSGENQNAARTFFNDAYRLLNNGGYTDIVFGYTREWDRLFRKDPAGFKYAVHSNSRR